jgi:hypothetical protein
MPAGGDLAQIPLGVYNSGYPRMHRRNSPMQTTTVTELKSAMDSGSAVGMR